MTTQIFTRIALTAAATLTATGVITAQPLAAHAGTFTVGGSQYDITTVTGTFLTFESLLSNTAKAPWWGRRDLAEEFASVVGDDLGFPNDAFFGPYFAFGEDDLFGGSVFSMVHVNAPNNLQFTGHGQNAERTWAVVVSATPVPSPALLPGLCGFGIAVYRKRKLASFTEA
jgi:hypothetical protein